jgi:hypothetical protein
MIGQTSGHLWIHFRASRTREGAMHESVWRGVGIPGDESNGIDEVEAMIFAVLGYVYAIDKGSPVPLTPPSQSLPITHVHDTTITVAFVPGAMMCNSLALMNMPAG